MIVLIVFHPLALTLKIRVRIFTYILPIKSLHTFLQPTLRPAELRDLDEYLAMAFVDVERVYD